ncbi:MAG: hypothetical protein M3Q14_02965 [bacterium]|nr:hypothetical protein [bacterium]
MKKFKNTKLLLPVIAITVLLLAFSVSFGLARRSEPNQTARVDNYQQPIDETGALIVDLNPEGPSPDQVNVPIGGSVQFNSRDGQKHALSLGSGSGERAHEENTTGTDSLAHGTSDPEHNEAEVDHEEFAAEDHDTTAHDHAESDYSSGTFQADEGWKVTFSKPGTYFFHDHFNPDLNILVVVYQPSAS